MKVPYFPYIFLSMLINGQVDSTERATADLLLDLVLIYPMHSSAVIFTVRIFRACMQRLLDCFRA